MCGAMETEIVGHDAGLSAASYGVVAGCAAGDALGAAVEGTGREELAEKFGLFEDFFDLKDIDSYRRDLDELCRFWRLPGAHTDDTQQFLSVLETFRRHGRLDGTLVAAGFADLYPWSRGEGRSFRQLCRGIREQGLSWKETRNAASAGNGAAMRAGAVAILHPRDEPRLVADAIRQASVTHGDVRSHLAAALIATATARAVHETRDNMLAIREVRDFHRGVCRVVGDSVPVVKDICVAEGLPCENLERRSGQFLESLDQITSFLDRYDRLELAQAALLDLIGIIAGNATEDRTHGRPATGTLNFALETPVSAYAVFLLFGTDCRRAILEAIRLGDDTDSTGAMAGQMSGALNGFHPRWWDFPEGPDAMPVATCAEAEHSVPIEWFLQLRVNVGLLYQVDAASGRPLLEVPRAMPVDALNSPPPSSFLEYERSVTKEERSGSKELRRLRKFMASQFEKLAAEIENGLKESPAADPARLVQQVRRLGQLLQNARRPNETLDLVNGFLAERLAGRGADAVALLDRELNKLKSSG